MTATAVRIQSATVPGTDVVVEVLQDGNGEYPFRTTRTANAQLRVQAVSTGFAREDFARSSARALWNEVVRNRNAVKSHSTVGRNQGAAFAPVSAAEIRTNAFGGSPKQETFLVSLLEDLSKLDGLGDNGQIRFDKAVKAGMLKTSRDTSAAIDLALGAVKDLRAKAPVPAETDTEDGATYRAPNGAVFHAYKGQSGRLLLKLWVAGGEDTDGEGGVFEYYGAATRLPKGSVKLTVEEMADFGRATGTCAICMRHLTDDESVARGIGPICWSKI